MPDSDTVLRVDRDAGEIPLRADIRSRLVRAHCDLVHHAHHAAHAH
ncbi:hypothetical protein [Paraburkholderia piptadeniae]|nr:hypothetical protein [Paraburkholderia piptadeniae]